MVNTHPYDEKNVHAIRTHCKKIRAALRLARHAIGEKAYRRENRCFRDTSRLLTPLRDATAQLRRLDRLSGDYLSIRKALTEDYQSARREVAEKRVFSLLANTLVRAKSRFEELKTAETKKSLRQGIKQLYRQGRRAKKQVAHHPTTQNIHEWRKQTKYLCYALQLLERQQPAFKPLRKRYEKLGRLLGDDHDLAMLRRRIADDPRLAGRPEAKRLLARIDRQRKTVQKSVRQLGKHTYTKKPGKL